MVTPPELPPSWQAPAPDPQPSRRKRPWLWVLIAAGVAILGGVGLLLARTTTQFTKVADEANAYAQLIIDGDLQEAFEQSCPTVRDELGFDAFERSMESLDLSAVYLTHVNIRSGTAGRRVAVVTGTMTSAGEEQPLTVEMPDVNGDWQVCGFYKTGGLPPPSEAPG